MANCIILRWDTRGKIISINEFGEKFFHCERGELAGKNLVGTIVPEADSSGKRLATMIRSIGKDPDSYVRNENENITRTGERVWVMWTNRPIADTEGRIVEILSVGNDITDRKRTEEALRKLTDELEERVASRTVELAEKHEELEKTYAELKESEVKIIKQEKMALLGQMAAGVAHEINNPAGFVKSNLETFGERLQRIEEFIRFQSEAIKAMAGSLGEDNAEKEVMAKRGALGIDSVLADSNGLIDECIEGMTRIEGIVQDFRNFARNGSESSTADLNSCIESALRIAWNQLKYKTVVTKEYSEVPSVKCNPSQLGQIFINLLVNAAQAMEHGEIAIRTWSDEGYGWASVRDEGSGIPEEHLERIFEPFFSTKPAGTGTGLGLSIVFDIASRHGGDIWVTNNAERGVTFTLRIPLAGNGQVIDSGNGVQ